jgi:VWFA-related protein
LSLFFAALTPAQQIEPQTAHPSTSSHQAAPTSAPQATVRTTTRLVQINVIVEDGHGDPVTGLRKDDFNLIVDKKSREIQLFSMETNAVPAMEAPAAPLPPNTYTNRNHHSADAGAATVILLDELNTDFVDKVFAREQVIEFLGQIQPQDHVALYWLGDKLRVLHDFSGEPATLRTALTTLRGEPSRTLSNSEVEEPRDINPSAPGGQTSDRDAFRRTFDQRAANDSTVDRVHATIAALLAIANHIGHLRGRKNLVWISSTFPFSLGYDKFNLDWANDTGVSFGSDIERAARSLTNANIAVYPVDARGLIGDAMKATRENEFPIGVQTELFGPPAGELDTMKILAARTGGRAFYNTNNISGAIRRALDDSRVTYTLGYYPDDVKWDGSFHTIKVRVNVSGASVRSRTGFFALPDPPRTSQNARAAVSQAAASQVDATSIRMTVDLQSFPEQAVEHQSAKEISAHEHPANENVQAAPTLTASLHLNLHDIQMEQKNGRWSGRIQSVFFLLNDRGEILGESDRTFRLLLEPPVYERTLQNGLSDTRRLPIPPNATRLCVVVRDTSNNSIGSLFIPLDKYLLAAPKASPTVRQPARRPS